MAEFAGTEVRAAGTSEVVSASDTKATTESRWAAGPLSGTTNVTYDYDGAAKFQLTLDPLALATPLTSLQLRIHLKAAEAPFLHTVTDLLRSHFSGRVPDGTSGEVWNSSGVYRFQLPAPFVPYVWVGGAERGIAVFADNDQGWIAAEPAFQLLRNGTTLTLVANIVSANSPNTTKSGGATWTQPRTIVIGMMATPAKPQPAAPMPSPRSWWPGEAGGAPAPGQLAMTMTGACYYQGSQM